MDDMYRDGMAVPRPLPKKLTPLEAAQLEFFSQAYWITQSDDERSYITFQEAARDLAEQSSDPQEQAQARTLSQLLKRFIKGYRRSIALSQAEAERVRDLTLALVKPLMPLNQFELLQHQREYPLDFLINLFSLADPTDGRESPTATREVQAVRAAFLEIGPRLTEAAYLAYVPHLAGAEEDFRPYLIGKEWQDWRALVERLSVQNGNGKERADAQTLLILLDAWQERGEPTKYLLRYLSSIVESLMLRIDPTSKNRVPPPPLPDEDAWYRLRPFTLQEETMYRWMDARQVAYDDAVARGDSGILRPIQCPLSDAELDRYNTWQRQQEGVPSWQINRLNHSYAWKVILERDRYWQQVRQRHRQSS